MLVAITGGNGFVGKALVKSHLDQHDQVRVLTRKDNDKKLQKSNSIEFYKADLSNCKSSDLYDFVKDADVLYHCAGELSDIRLMEALHVNGTQTLLEAAQSVKLKRWVQLSSVGVYGSFPSTLVDENYPYNPIGIYETTKTQSDNLLLEAARNGKINCIILRPSIIYGTEMPNNSMYQLIGMIDRGLFFYIGRPGAIANYIHIDNVIYALNLCSQCVIDTNYQIYNLSDSQSFEYLVSTISVKLGRTETKTRIPKLPLLILTKIISTFIKFPLTVNRINALSDRSVYDTTKLKKELGYQHKVSLKNGLIQMVDQYIKKYKN